MSPDDWRSTEALKALRQIQTCPYCGALISTADGLTIHTQWHDGLMSLVNQIDANFDLIFDYVTNPATGLEKRLTDLVSSASSAIDTLRTDATNAITTTNNSITILRNDATSAITGVTNRVTVVENEITRVPGGIWNRLTVLEANAGVTAQMTQASSKGELPTE